MPWPSCSAFVADANAVGKEGDDGAFGDVSPYAVTDATQCMYRPSLSQGCFCAGCSSCCWYLLPPLLQCCKQLLVRAGCVNLKHYIAKARPCVCSQRCCSLQTSSVGAGHMLYNSPWVGYLRIGMLAMQPGPRYSRTLRELSGLH